MIFLFRSAFSWEGTCLRYIFMKFRMEWVSDFPDKWLRKGSSTRLVSWEEAIGRILMEKSAVWNYLSPPPGMSFRLTNRLSVESVDD
jgi:hypothetical protein